MMRGDVQAAKVRLRKEKTVNRRRKRRCKRAIVEEGLDFASKLGEAWLKELVEEDVVEVPCLNFELCRQVGLLVGGGLWRTGG
jgi:hypothetical protein